MRKRLSSEAIKVLKTFTESNVVSVDGKDANAVAPFDELLKEKLIFETLSPDNNRLFRAVWHPAFYVTFFDEQD